MKPFRPEVWIPTSFLIAVLAALALTCAPGMATFAQHGGGHVGGGHFAGSAHVAAPHASGPGVVHTAPSHPTILYLPPVAGAAGRTFVTTPPPVHLISPPGTSRPVLGNRVMPPVIAPPAEPHTTIGFPATGVTGGSTTIRFSPVMSFSGQGHTIWQDSANPGRVRGTGTAVGGAAPIGSRFPRRPRFPGPIFPIFGPPNFGFLGSPFFGLGLGFGFNSVWWPSCGPFWGWGYGCNAYPYYDYGYGFDGYAPNNLEGQVETQSGPQMYENPYPPSPLYLYGGGERELAQLYFKDGTIYYVTDYWLVNDQLHFTTVEEGGTKSLERVVDFDQLDLQRTINENTARGFRFVLRNEPIEQYLQDHPDTGASTQGPQTGPAGPLPSVPLPSAAPAQPGQPQQPTAPPQP